MVSLKRYLSVASLALNLVLSTILHVQNIYAFRSNPNSASYAPIRNDMTGKCIDAPGDLRSGGNKIIQWHCHGGANQGWEFRSVGNNYYTIHLQANPNMCLDAPGGQYDNVQLILWPCHGGENQQWWFGFPPDYSYMVIHNRYKKDKCVDADPAGRNGDRILAWNCHYYANQRW